MEKQAIVLYPSPERGHFVSMVEFGNHLLTHHPHSFSVTVLLTAAAPSTASAYPSLTFLRLPSLSHASLPFFDLVRLLNPDLRRALLSIPNLTAFVADFFCGAAVEVAAGIGVPFFFYFPCGANFVSPFLYLPTMDKMFDKSFIDLGDQIVRIPGLPPLPASDMSSGMIDRRRRIYEYYLEASVRMANSDGLIVNTFHALEESAVNAIAAGECVPEGHTPPIYCVGPLVAVNGDGVAANRHECLIWLDSQPRRSVVFLSFGSMGSFSKEQLREIAVALERSGVRFLWVVRTPPPENRYRRRIAAPDLESILPAGFAERTRGKGLVVTTWAPQVEVLSHDSVGGFVTHCGWNSIIEAVSAGVPMVAWPQYAEQKVNRAFLVVEAKAALTVAESDGWFVRAAELERRVTELMSSEKGRVLRERAEVLRESAMAAHREGGSSRVALTDLVKSFKHLRDKRTS